MNEPEMRPNVYKHDYTWNHQSNWKLIQDWRKYFVVGQLIFPSMAEYPQSACSWKVYYEASRSRAAFLRLARIPAA